MWFWTAVSLLQQHLTTECRLYGTNHAGYSLWFSTVHFEIVSYKHKQAKTASNWANKGPQNGATLTDPHSCDFLVEELIEICPETWRCWETHPSWPVTPALVKPHHMFNYGLSCSCSLTSWGSCDPQVHQLLVINFSQDGQVVSSLKHTL
jgi:hypothetical protein